MTKNAQAGRRALSAARSSALRLTRRNLLFTHLLVVTLAPVEVQTEDGPVPEEEHSKKSAVVHAKPLVGALSGRGNGGKEGRREAAKKDGEG